MKTISALTIVMAAFLGGCSIEHNSHNNNEPKMMADKAMEVHSAVAVVHPADGQKVMGTVTFTDVDGGVKVKGEIKGFEPNSKHGFHVHEFGDCSDSAKFTSAGGHFNPEGAKHGGPDTAAHHGGDLGNITADGSGNASVDMVMKGISVGGKDAILGRSIVVHAKEDDLKTDPSGNSGDRVGCGVIGIKKP